MCATNTAGSVALSSYSELVGINEIAAMAGFSRQAVANWRARFRDFPAPVVELAAGPVFRTTQVRSWLRRRKIPMARVVSLINLKGGVAKTTTTVALAETLASQFGKRILVIDLDPQTNATTILIGEKRWKEINEKGLDTRDVVQGRARSAQQGVRPVENAAKGRVGRTGRAKGRPAALEPRPNRRAGQARQCNRQGNSTPLRRSTCYALR